jgi:hypothetical protein
MKIKEIAFALTLAGCAADGQLGLSDCKSADWYRYGYRDGSASAARSNLPHYVAECAASGIKPDEAAYNKGLQQGILDFSNRRRF